ncbi:patatin-like protein 7 [Aristolochia californica]|uniref:patatin-like protein 7 n=1 Tax=Aristolochia californica TaxID=171875 RepID=UPI0035D7E914
MALITEAAPVEPSFDVDKLSYEIFSILEAKFLFGYDDPKLFVEGSALASATPAGKLNPGKKCAGKVRILSIDAGGPTDGLLAAKSLAFLEDSLRRSSGVQDACIADFFDIAAGSGSGGVLAALLFTKGEDGRGRPLFSAAEALKFLAENHRQISRPKIVRRLFRRPKVSVDRVLRKVFSEETLKDTLKPLLIPCYDLSSGGAFVFSRADALETDGFDFKMREVCLATSADPTAVGAVEMKSIDGQTKIAAVDGGIAMSNPTAAAITHVLNNKQEFPYANGVEDLMVVSLGNGDSSPGLYGSGMMTPAPRDLVRIAGEGVSDMVDQSVSMAFGQSWSSNYVRIQGNGFGNRKSPVQKGSNSSSTKLQLEAAEEMLKQKNVESLLFRGKKIGEKTNKEKLNWFAGELVKENERRKTSSYPTVVLKQATPRSSSATISSCSSN